MIRSGLDWSGDGGEVARQGSSDRLITVVASIDDREWHLLDGAAQRVRELRRLSTEYTFKYNSARPEVREAFFHEVRSVPFVALAYVADEHTWTEQYVRGSSGIDRVIDTIVAIISAAPDVVVAGQVLLIDLPSDENALVNQIRVALSRTLRTAGRRSFAKVKPCPDHRYGGAIVQLADMIAGALND